MLSDLGEIISINNKNKKLIDKMSRFLCFLTAAVVAQTNYKTFSSGIAQGSLTSTEKIFYTYNVSEGSTHAAITHIWISSIGPNNTTPSDFCQVRVYVDGEAEASIDFQPLLAAGIGFGDASAPRGNRWIGKQADYGGVYFNIRIPFMKSVVVTYQSSPGYPDASFYMIVHGSENIPTTIGGITIPIGAKLILQTTEVTMQPLDYVDAFALTQGSGILLMTTLAFASGNLNTLEGCVRFYSPYTQTYSESQLIATGTEDYFVSSYYFNAGPFYGDMSGLTHYSTPNGTVQLSAFRLHDQDPLGFSAGVRLVWRNGDVTDPATGLKCTLETGGNTVGSPTVANATLYGWAYVW
jgi:Protein of unknown function (DUF2961)